MTDITLANGFTNSVANTPEVAYTSPAGTNGTKIKALTVSNPTTSNKTFKVFISGTNSIIPLKVLIRSKTHTGYEIIGHLIPSGATLSIESSEAESVQLTATGEVI